MKYGFLRLGKYILLLLLLLCFGCILSVNTEIGRYNPPLIYYTDHAALSSETVSSMREEEEPDEAISWTAVQTLDSRNFSNEALNREATGTLLLLDGFSANLVSSTGELMADDLTGCILSTEAAWELFGETEVSGGEIICNEVSYEVRGVYEDTECVVLLPAETYYAAENTTENIQSDGISEFSDGSSLTGDTTEAEFDKIVAVPDSSLTDAQRSEAIEAFETTYAMGEDKTDCVIYRRIAGVFAMVIPTLVMMVVMITGIVNLVKIRRKILRLIIGCAVLAAVVALFFILFQIRPSIPADLIPNTWSDFDFWKEKLAVFVSDIRHLLFSDKFEIELRFYRPLVRMSALTGIGSVLFVLTVLCFRADSYRYITETDKGKNECRTTIRRNGTGVPESLRDFVTTLFITCIVEFISVFLLYRRGISLDDKRLLIYLWPYFLVSRYVLMITRSSD